MNPFKYIAVIALFFAGNKIAISAQTTPVLKQRTHLIADNLSPMLAQDTVKKIKAERKAIKAADLKKLLESKRFTFHAQYANPLGGGYTSLNGQLINISPQGNGHIYLTSEYDVRIRPDSVIAFLPYFGRTTFAPSINPNDAGVKFSSVKFGYKVSNGKKGNTVITITPTDAQYNQKMILDISKTGMATLQMIIVNRNSIAYDGYIDAK